jgi:hypothetical protein
LTLQTHLFESTFLATVSLYQYAPYTTA